MRWFDVQMFTMFWNADCSPIATYVNIFFNNYEGGHNLSYKIKIAPANDIFGMIIH